MLPVKRQPNETLEAWEVRLIAEQPERERAHIRAATMALSEAEYRIKVSLLTAPPRPACASPLSLTHAPCPMKIMPQPKPHLVITANRLFDNYRNLNT